MENILQWTWEKSTTSAILPKFMRKIPTLENVIPTLYLKGISTNKFQDALTAIFGESAKAFSPATITRLKEVWKKLNLLVSALESVLSVMHSFLKQNFRK